MASFPCGSFNNFTRLKATSQSNSPTIKDITIPVFKPGVLVQKYLNLAGALIGFSSILIVLILQYAFDMQPCPLCIFERIVILALSVVMFLSFYLDRVYLRLIMSMFFIKGLLLAGYHSYILLNPENTCSVFWSETLLQLNMTVPWLDWLLESTSLCGHGKDTFLGVLLPIWVVVLLGGMAYFAYYSHINLFSFLYKKVPEESGT